MHSNYLLASALPSLSRRRLLLAAAGGVVSACGGGGGGSTPPPSGLPLLPRPPIVPVDGPAWVGFAGDAQHSARGRENVAAQTLRGFYWYSAIDLAPQLNASGSLLTHYGSPVITRSNVVIVPVKTGAGGGFRVDAMIGATGDPLWSLGTDYITPPHNWIPSFNPALARADTATPLLYLPAAGGGVFVLGNLEAPNPNTPATPVTFYGDNVYNASPAAYNATVFINTPITADNAGNVYFGFMVTGSNPAGPPSGGIARIDANGVGSYVTATQATGDPTLVKTQMNSGPALSNDGATLYVVFNSAAGRPSGRLVALDAVTLQTIRSQPLVDPANGQPAWVSDDSTASPLVGPDGDVYIGVLEATGAPHNFRGWLLHFNGALTQSKTPGAFGWDNTPSIVPASVRGSASYLLLTKYNNYLGTPPNGDGDNRVALLDPNQTQPDPVSGTVPVMREVITIAGPTAEGGGAPAGAVREWCVNTAVVDPVTQCALINSEDGTLYRWDLVNNGFSERIALNSGVAQSYTPTVLGPDGRIYAVNNAIIHSIGQ